MIVHPSACASRLNLQPDPWLAAIFGCPVFKLSVLDTDDPSSLSLIPQHEPSFAAESAFCYTKVPTRRMDQVRALADVGFAVVDVNVVFERNVLPEPDWPTGATITVREIQPHEHTSVLEIAASCFIYSRFHMDPQIPSHVANRIKGDWIEAYVRKQRGERLLVAVFDGKPVGFLAELRTVIEGSTVGVIDLIGVDQRYKRQGIARSLMAHFIRDSARRINRLRVGTQVANVPSIRLYEKCGFQMAEALYVLHAHVRGGKVHR